VDATYLFAKNFVNTKYEDLSSDLVEATKKEVLDALGVGLAGFGALGVKELLDITTEWGGKGESSIILCKQKVPAPHAAQVNATMIHALDYDDIHESGIMHPAVVAVPTSMAVAEKKGELSGREFITAVALGVDMMCRLGMATKCGTNAGWHFTTLYGFLGASGIAGRLLRLDEKQMVNALGIAYHQCSGNGQCVKDGALTKRMGPGFSVRGGITAALLAERGVTGAKNSLEGEWGLYRVYLQGSYDATALIADLGKHFEGINVSIKPYPCCRGTHPAIDAALALVYKYNIRTENVQKVTIFVGEGFHRLLCTPLDAKLKPRNIVDAQFSIPWGVATAIARRRVIMEDFTEAAIKSKDILDVTNKIDVQLDTCYTSQTLEPTKVIITTKNGEVYSEKVDHPLGSPQRPMSFDDCTKKFKDCASYPEKKLSDERIDAVIELVGRLEELKDIREIIKLLTAE
jgi:2-methylcitrate dehydratase PrpD